MIKCVDLYSESAYVAQNHVQPKNVNKTNHQQEKIFGGTYDKKM